MDEKDAPCGRRRRFTDEELAADLDAGLTASQVAAKYGVRRQSVYERIDRRQMAVAAAALQPEEARRFAGRTVDAMEELAKGLHRTNLLQDACDEWLRDPDHPEQYDVGPRAAEISVVYSVEICTGEDRHGRPRTRIETRRARLSTLLALCTEDPKGDPIVGCEKTESRHADPRDLILRTAQEVRQSVATMADLARMLADARIMERFRQALLEEIAQVDHDVASRIAEAVRRSLILHNAFRGPEALPGG